MIRTLIALSLIASPLAAEEVSFARGWAHQKLTFFSNNTWQMGSGGLSVVSDGGVSIVWTRLDQRHWNAREASWTWEVSESVPATDLQRKGGDDRNFAVYFFFLPEAEARAMGNAGIRQMQGNSSARVLTYIWGGDYGRGARIGSPWLEGQGDAVALRAAGTGRFSESVDLRRDLEASFGGQGMVLVGMAVSADSDDTGGRVVGMMEGVRLR